MNAPQRLPAVHTSLPIAVITASKTNPRKSFDPATLAELTDSIKRNGVLQPILVRPSPDGGPGYELVAGERRLRAATTAGLTEIPALIRDLTDTETLEMQVIENLQREGLHPLEEAEGYEQILKLPDYTVADLATKVGKSVAYVYARMKLCALAPKARKAFYAGKLTPSTALLIARIPVRELQEKAVAEIIEPDYRGEAISFRAAADHLHRHFMLRLNEAPFDITSLQLVAAAGACGACPKRTGNQPELFGDVKDADVCTDPTCFDAKRAAHFNLVRQAAQVEGRKIISGKAAKEAMPYGSSSHHTVGFFRPEDKPYDDPKKRTYGQIAKAMGVEAQLLEVPKSGDLVEVLSETAMKAAMRKAGIGSQQLAREEKVRDSDKREKLKLKLDEAVRERVFSSLRGRMTAELKISVQDGVLVALALWERADYNQKLTIVDLWGWSTQPPALKQKKRTGDRWNEIHGARERIAALTALELWRLMIELAVVDEVAGYNRDGAPMLMAAAGRHGVDIEAIRKDVTAELKPKVVAKPKKKASTGKRTAVDASAATPA